LPTFVGLRVFVYNGKKFMPIKIMPEMVGHKFGAFSSTRTFTKKFSNTKK
jgi:small subunit ribosomal protein S19